jgi:hypothetical protein
MCRRLYKRCLIWLLPLLVAQSLVPVGFMVAGGGSGLQIEFCPVQSAQVLAALEQQNQPITHHAHHHEHAADQANGASEGGSSDHARSHACPYALVATAIASSPVASIASIELIQVEVRNAPEHRPPVEPVRSAANRVRGPPPVFS